MALRARKLMEKITRGVSRFRFPHAVGKSMETARRTWGWRSARRFDGALRPKLLVRRAVALLAPEPRPLDVPAPQLEPYRRAHARGRAIRVPITSPQEEHKCGE